MVALLYNIYLLYVRSFDELLHMLNPIFAFISLRYLVPSQKLAFTDIPNGLAATSKVPLVGWAQMVAFAGIIEIFNLQGVSPTGTAGDYEGYGAFGIPFGKGIADAEKRKKSLAAEINNGRLAMMAIIGMFYQDGLTGSAWGDWANYTDSPLRAAPDFSGELGPIILSNLMSEFFICWHTIHTMCV